MAATSQDPAKFNDYDGFVEKFKPKKTTDDCYTPPYIYEAVAGYVACRWNIDPESFVRPFYPGGDYERYDYPDGCTVVDNPPFSILSEIIAFYQERGIRFFLFAPHLTLFSTIPNGVSAIVCNCKIIYENGADVPTSFKTNLPAPFISNAPDLYAAVMEAQKLHKTERKLPKREYPRELLMVSMLDKATRNGIPFSAERGECAKVSKLDCQERGKSLFGGGYLLGRGAAARLEAARLEAAERFELSERERETVDSLGR